MFLALLQIRSVQEENQRHRPGERHVTGPHREAGGQNLPEHSRANAGSPTSRPGGVGPPSAAAGAERAKRDHHRGRERRTARSQRRVPTPRRLLGDSNTAAHWWRRPVWLEVRSVPGSALPPGTGSENIINRTGT